jgi:hypothetical protein
MAASRSITLATMDIAQALRQRPARMQKLLKLFISICLQAQAPHGCTAMDSTETDRFRVYQASELLTALESLKAGHDSGSVAVDISPGRTVSVSLLQPILPKRETQPNCAHYKGPHGTPLLS